MDSFAQYLDNGTDWDNRFDVLATSKVISGRAPTCDSVHSWQLYSALPTERPAYQHHDLISLRHIILTLSQPDNAEHLARK